MAAGLGAVLANAAGAGDTGTALIGCGSAVLYAVLVVLPGHWGYRRLLGGQAPGEPSDEPY